LQSGLALALLVLADRIWIGDVKIRNGIESVFRLRRQNVE
jgi:hypothetical protein